MPAAASVCMFVFKILLLGGSTSYTTIRLHYWCRDVSRCRCGDDANAGIASVYASFPIVPILVLRCSPCRGDDVVDAAVTVLPMLVSLTASEMVAVSDSRCCIRLMITEACRCCALVFRASAPCSWSSNSRFCPPKLRVRLFVLFQLESRWR
jgi:hypothetical protein